MRNLTVAGRTDAGVHATGQVCHLDIAADRWAALGGSLVHRLAGLLPPDVRVFAVAEAPPGFDARFSALFRRYAYRVADGPWGAPPLRHRDTYAWPRRLDLAALAEASAALLGEHDFAAFCRRKEHATTVRAVTELSWRRDPDDVVVATIQADAFCRSMVRSLVGALLPVGDGRRPPTWPGSLLVRRRAGQRGRGGAGARAHPGRGRLPGGPGRAGPAGRADPPAPRLTVSRSAQLSIGCRVPAARTPQHADSCVDLGRWRSSAKRWAIGRVAGTACYP